MSSTERPCAKGICDLSGFEYPLRDLVKTWDGFMAHPSWADTQRHPQDYVTGRKEHTLPYTRPEAPDEFLTTNQVTPGSL